MKTLNLPALGQITLEDMTCFLSWLERLPNGEVSPNSLEKNSPIRTSKLNPMLKVLDQFGFVFKKDSRFKITMSGKDFSQSSLSVKKAILRILFLKIEAVQRIADLLKRSTTGRLQKRIVSESFHLGSISPFAESEILAFISWGQSCELFDYDKKKEEILFRETLLPVDPQGPGISSNLGPSPIQQAS